MSLFLLSLLLWSIDLVSFFFFFAWLCRVFLLNSCTANLLLTYAVLIHSFMSPYLLYLWNLPDSLAFIPLLIVFPSSFPSFFFSPYQSFIDIQFPLAARCAVELQQSHASDHVCCEGQPLSSMHINENMHKEIFFHTCTHTYTHLHTPNEPCTCRQASEQMEVQGSSVFSL